MPRGRSTAHCCGPTLTASTPAAVPIGHPQRLSPTTTSTATRSSATRACSGLQPGDHPLERLRRVDHGGVFRGHAGGAVAANETLTQVQLQAVYPDGYSLAASWASDTGEIQRHRAFYIIDRTIPVGFQRGQDMNVEKAILINRFIE